MIRAILALFRKPSPRPPEPRWTPSDAEALAKAVKNRQARSALRQRQRDAVHAELAREVWG